MLSTERRAIIAEEAERAKAIDSTIDTCRRESERAASHGSDDLVLIYNLALYVCLSERDQGLLKVDALRADDSDHARQSFVARQLATLLYEVSGDLRQKAFTRPIRETVQALDPDSEDEWGEVNRLAQRFWRRHRTQLKNWRNVAAAHRDFDALRQLRAIQEIELGQIMSVAVEFSEVPRRLLPLLTRVLEKTWGWDGARKVLQRAKNGLPDE